MEDIKLDSPTENAISTIQDTELTPMEEVLFKSWTKANQIAKPDAADDHMDYRGVWKETGGAILPFGQANRIAKRTNAETTIKRTLTDRLMSAKKNAAEAAFKKATTDATKFNKETSKAADF